MLGSPLGRARRASLGGEFVSPPIGKAAALGPPENEGSAFTVIHVAGVVTKIELGTVVAKVRFAYVVIFLLGDGGQFVTGRTAAGRKVRGIAPQRF